MFSQPVIFVSAVSQELRGARDLVAKTLLNLGYQHRREEGRQFAAASMVKAGLHETSYSRVE